MAQFGITTPGALWSANMGAGLLTVSPAVLAAAGDLTKLSHYIRSGNASQSDFRGVIYANSAGQPGAKLGETSVVVLAGSSPEGWVDTTFASPITLAAGTYWIGMLSVVGNWQYNRDNAANGNMKFRTGQSSPTPDPFGSPTDAAFIQSINGTYTPAATPPVNTVAPAVTGTVTQDNTLSCTTGTWTGDVSSGYTYKWQRDNFEDLVFADIPGATSSTYVLTIADVDCNVRCVVTATGTGGATSANSNVVGPVVPGAPVGGGHHRIQISIGIGI